ncbi:thioredoxin-related transmembrane protein 1 [Octopus bimaculoides]|uniref:thioredoxin-related transmembrane protein 1 n=1 Tax=Octopus bimaculoides TaxID=37653 RepID=UPI00071CF7D6|nr:thioredoxin-related transmembrane protein 1 [Octopus bimaculoides]|eukprot:XP_014790208.1 PREDICTED: thioredoxin-related transmembrane protein 1-like [Octopus bimaculoides]
MNRRIYAKMDVHNLSLTVLSAIFFLLLVPLSCVAQKGKAISLTDDNWNQVLEGEWMIKFMAPWCPACQSFKDIWENYTSWAEDLNIHVAIVDVTQNPGLSGRFLVTSLPTIFHVKDGVFRYYQGPRILGDLISFIEDNCFKAFSYPNLSHRMSSLSLFFKAAMFIRSLYSTMTEVYGIPEWGCYVIFALATLLVGFIAGMLIVCCVDLLFPVSVQSLSKPAPHPSHVARQKEDREDREKDDESDIVDDTAGSKETLRQRNPQQQQQQPTQDE